MRQLLLIASLLFAPATMAAIPLVDYGVPGADASFDATTLKSSAEWKGQRIALPDRQLVTDMVAEGNRLFLASRTVFDGTIRLWVISDGKLAAIPAPIAHRELLTQKLFVAKGMLYLIAYDTHRTTNQLFRRPLDAAPSQRWAAAQPDLKFGALYELNVPIFHVTHQGQDMLCGGETCFVLGDGEPTAFTTPPGYTLLDVASDKAVAYGLYMKVIDDRNDPFPGRFGAYYYTRPLPEGKLKPLLPWRIPGALTLKNGKPHITYLRNAQDATASYFADFRKLPNAGTALMGTSNRDGRQSWGQIYYLNGLLDLVSTQYPQPLLPLGAAQKQEIADRITVEMQLLDRLLTDSEWLNARRYSMHREPLAAPMHLSRALRLMQRYMHEHPAPMPLKNYAQLKKDTLDLKRTFSEIATLDDGRQYLKYRHGVAFWADGLNMPHNYQTGWAEGLVMGYGDSLPETGRSLVRDIYSIWYEYEIKPRLGTDDWHWHYWWGTALKGYTKADSLSTNTPEYVGDPSLAHISYRTMDAMGALEVVKVVPDALPAAVKPYLKEGIENGNLYPFASEAFSPEERPCIPKRIARFYARYPSVYEMQNAVWALSALNRTCD